MSGLFFEIACVILDGKVRYPKEVKIPTRSAELWRRLEPREGQNCRISDTGYKIPGEVVVEMDLPFVIELLQGANINCWSLEMMACDMLTFYYTLS
jgi:hypothetical protein